jgi:hypothetical protein
MMQRPAPPMDLPDVIAAAWSGCVHHWRVLLAIAVWGALVAAALNYGSLRASPDLNNDALTADQAREALLRAGPFIAAGAVVELFLHLSLVRAALAFGRDAPVPARDCLLAGARALPAAAVAFFIALMVLVLFAFTVLLLPIGVYWLFTWLFAPQVIVDEHRGPLAALVRSRQLVRGLWWHTFAVGVSIVLLTLLPQFALGRLGSIQGSHVGAAVITGVITLFTAPFLAMGHTVLYLDTRRRKGEPVRPAPPVERVGL